MKKFTTLMMLRPVMAATLCFAFVLYLPSRLSVASGATKATSAPAALKSESQYRIEATRYVAAIRAISGIGTMRLDTVEDIKKALDILKRERPNLKFHRSKLVTLGLSDTTFANGVKKRAFDKQAAEAFAKELAADRKRVLKIDGADSLGTRLRRSDESDAAVLRQAAEKLKAASERLKKTAQKHTAPGGYSTTDFKPVKATFHTEESMDANESLRSAWQGRAKTDFEFTEDHTIALAVTAVVLITVVVGAALIRNIFTDEGRDAIEECLKENDDRRERCIADLGNLTYLDLLNPFFVAAIALCETDWMVRAAACLLAP